MIAGENEDVACLGLLDGVDVLIDGVGGALVPVFVDALLRREDFDIFVERSAEETPAGGDVTVEAVGLVLREDEDTAEAGVDAVGEGEVDDAIEAAEGDGWLGAVASERLQTGALAAGENQGKDIVKHEEPRRGW